MQEVLLQPMQTANLGTAFTSAQSDLSFYCLHTQSIYPEESRDTKQGVSRLETGVSYTCLQIC